jgi:transcriptional regulator with XRE-family HTH domain
LARTALSRLIQERREDLGYSRARLGELVGIKPATIEAWELGRVAKPPVHDVLRLARFLAIPLEEIEAAALGDEGPEARPPPQPEATGKVPLLEQAIELFGWTNEHAAAALDATPEQVAAWRSGEVPMPLPTLMTVAALIALHAAGAVGGTARIADLAEALARSPAPRAPHSR